MGRLFLARMLLVVGLTFFFFGATHHCHRRWRHGSFPRKALAPVGNGTSPASSCDHLACPPYKSVHEESDFEIREYREAVWAETEPLLDASFDKATGSGFRSLFQYIQGRNEDGAQIPMTAPVLTTIKPSGGPFCSSTFTVKFFVPPQFSSAPPKPTAGLGVDIVTLPKRCVAVRRFPGFATDFNVAQEAKLLADSLERTAWSNITSLEGRSEVYSIAQYNSPFEIFSRVNEVWVPFAAEKGSEDCTPEAAAAASASSAAVEAAVDAVAAELAKKAEEFNSVLATVV